MPLLNSIAWEHPVVLVRLLGNQLARDLAEVEDGLGWVLRDASDVRLWPEQDASRR